LLVDVVERRLPIPLDPMVCLAQLNCSLTDAALDLLELRAADQARTRHPSRLHPRPVAAPVHLSRHAAR
jgi:hypothetical protein